MNQNHLQEYDFSGRVALVTGGTRGIGRQIAFRLGQAGAKVVVNYRSNQVAADLTITEFRKAGMNCTAIAADVSDQQEVLRLVAETEDRMGPIDLLVNNAGVFDYLNHTELDAERWRHTMETNVDSMFYCTWAVKDKMMERQFGRVVNITSIAGLEAKPYAIAYATSKAAMIGFTRSAGHAFASHNVRVNAVAPGLIDTEILADVQQDVLQQLIDRTPAGRIGTVDDVASLVLFLLSEQADYISGQTMVVSGGRVTLP